MNDRTIKLGEVIKINQNNYSNIDSYEFVNYLDTGNITNNTINKIQFINLNYQKLPSRAKRKVNYNSIIYSMVRPNQRHFGIIKSVPNNFLVSTGFAVIDVDKNLCDADYIYYYLTQNKVIEKLQSIAEQSVSTYPSIKPSDLENMNIILPSLEKQKKISQILLGLDNKINLNMKINDNLEKLLVYMYENMIKNHTDWTNATLDQFCNIFTGKKNANQYNKNGIYKFFTCGEKILRINSYIFDGPAIIISGNGSYTGRTLFYNGKFDLYQRTYACTLKPNIPNSYIYVLYIILKVALHKKISGGTHGSSIPYIVMNDIAKFEFKLNYELFKIFSNYAKNILTLIQKNDFESQKLSDIRNVFLPKLMNNDINISDFYL